MPWFHVEKVPLFPSSTNTHLFSGKPRVPPKLSKQKKEVSALKRHFQRFPGVIDLALNQNLQTPGNHQYLDPARNTICGFVCFPKCSSGANLQPCFLGLGRRQGLNNLHHLLRRLETPARQQDVTLLADKRH